VKGLLIMPGIVDAHIHLGHGADISRPRISRDAETESAAAAAGGVTTFLSYVISGKPFEPALIDEVCAVTAAGSRVDFGLHLVISTEEQLADVASYAKTYGIPSFKLFMYSRGGEGLRIGLSDIDDGFLFRWLRVADAKAFFAPLRISSPSWAGPPGSGPEKGAWLLGTIPTALC
jgi:dihydroorotase-like cyclic amidohydrolase